MANATFSVFPVADQYTIRAFFKPGYPICPYIEDHKKYIENVVGLPVKVGTHPMPSNYIRAHAKAGDWKRDGADVWLKDITGSQEDTDKYDSTNPNFLKN